jgi:hypothetical protein
MDLEKILSISGHGGLFKMISQARNGIIVEHLETKKRMPAYATSKISALADISVYTDDEDMPLADILKKMYEHEEGGPAMNPKSGSEELKEYFGTVVPEYDRERVYVSDIKRILKWYNILQKLDMLDFTEEEKEDTKEPENQETEKPEAETKQEGSSEENTSDKPDNDDSNSPEEESENK